MTTIERPRPTNLTDPYIEWLCEEMRSAGRPEMISFAGAVWRDDMAWQVCLAWLSDRTASVDVLRERALRSVVESATGLRLSP